MNSSIAMSIAHSTGAAERAADRGDEDQRRAAGEAGARGDVLRARSLR